MEKIELIIDNKNEYYKQLDRWNLLFKDFPGSPLKNWRPSLANLRSPNSIKKGL